MKSVAFVLLVWVAFKPSCRAQTANEKVWKAIVALDEALVRKDSAALLTMLTDDFVGAVPSGKSFKKIDYIRYHCKPNIGLVALEEFPMSQAVIRLYENIAVVNRRVHAKLKKPDGSVSEFDVQRIEVCHKEKGEWQLASGQGTEVNLALRP